MRLLRMVDEKFFGRILDWLFEPAEPKGRVGRHRTPEGMLSTAQTIGKLQLGWGYGEVAR